MRRFLKVPATINGKYNPEYHKIWRQLVDTPERRRRNNIAATACAKRSVQYMQAIKLARGCIDCGYRDHHAALEFDHVRGEKKFIMAALRALRPSRARLDAEIAKCEVRCSNCHRIKTWRARQSG